MESRTNGKTPGHNETLLQEHTPACPVPAGVGRSPAVYFLLSAVYSVLVILPGLSTAAAAKPAKAATGPGRDPVAVPTPAEYLFSKLDPFYKKHLSAGGLLITSSEKVSDYALKEAVHLVGRVLAGRRDVLKVLVRHRAYVGVMAYNEMTTDMPECRRMSPWWDKRARGLGGQPMFCAEENLLNFKGDPYKGESIFIHEFAHRIHGGLSTVDKTFKTRLKALHAKAKQAGRFSGYGMSKPGEFWAEGVQSWFNCNRAGGLAVRKPGGKRHLQINTRDQLKTHMPEYAKFLAEALGGNKWTYTPAIQRLHQPHLKGYDPAKAPVFKWPRKVIEAFNRIEAEKAKKKKRAK